MSDLLERLRARRAELLGAIGAEPTGDERARLKSEIVALFREADDELTAVTEFRESIRDLIARFKELPAVERTSVRHDHIGASTHIERGWSRLACAEWTEAEEEFRRAMHADRTNTTAVALLAWALVGQRRRDDAVAACDVVVQRDRSNPLAAVALGLVHLQDGDLDRAGVHLGAALAGGDPRATLYAHYWLAVVSHRRAEFDEAAAHARRAVALGPNLGEGWVVLGEAYWSLGAVADARQAWATGAQARHSPHAARCRELMENSSPTGVPPQFPPP